jgi:hypothetical protein
MRQPLVFRPGQIIVNAERSECFTICDPWSPLGKRKAAMLLPLRDRRNRSRHMTTDHLTIRAFAFVADDGEARLIEFIERPYVSRPTMLRQLEDKQVRTASFNKCVFVFCGQDPDIAKKIRRVIVTENRFLDGSRLDVYQSIERTPPSTPTPGRIRERHVAS